MKIGEIITDARLYDKPQRRSTWDDPKSVDARVKPDDKFSSRDTLRRKEVMPKQSSKIDWLKQPEMTEAEIAERDKYGSEHSLHNDELARVARRAARRRNELEIDEESLDNTLNMTAFEDAEIDEGSMAAAAHKKSGAKFGGYWKGTDKGPPKPGQGVGGAA